MRQLKLDERAIAAILDRLDEESGDVGRSAADVRFPYRVRAMRVDVVRSRDETDSHVVASRNVGPRGVAFLSSQVLHTGSACTVHLVTVQNTWQRVAGTVTSCRYLQGTACVHEVDVAFSERIDPALFSPSATRARVLVVDDSPMARRLTAHLLEPLNVEVVAADSGVAAVREALAAPFDLILMDVEMPQLDGLSAVRLLRKKGYLRPIAAMSCSSAGMDREACLLAGCDDYVPKPPQRERLAALIKRTRPQPLVSALLHEPGMAPLIDEFVLDLLRRSCALEQAYHARDMERLAFLARELRGEAGGFGFDSITTAAHEVEQAIGRGVRLIDLRSHLSGLVRLCLAARPATCAVADQVRAAALPADGAAGESSVGVAAFDPWGVSNEEGAG
jgi:CheY-like chemotaxis protein